MTDRGLLDSDLNVYPLGAGLYAIQLEIDDDDPEAAARTAYRRLLKAGRALGAPYFLRVWQFFDRIHDPAILGTAQTDTPDSALLDRYQAFCVGRAEALAEARIAARHMPAATAIGRLTLDHPARQDTLNTPLRRGLAITALMAARPGVLIENPRQTPAHQYPERYSPRAPAFARATLLRGIVAEALPFDPTPAPSFIDRCDESDDLLLVSGTASIVGHESRHPGDVVAQLNEIFANLEALVAETDRVRAARLKAPDRHNAPGNNTPRPALKPRHLRVYLRHAEDVHTVARRLEAWCKGAHLSGTSVPGEAGATGREVDDGPRVDFALGEICRPELLVEIEAIFSTRKVADA